MGVRGAPSQAGGFGLDRDPRCRIHVVFVFLIAAIKGTLQAAKEKLADLRRKKEQLLSQLQSVQDTLGRDQGLFWVFSAPIITSNL